MPLPGESCTRAVVCAERQDGPALNCCQKGYHLLVLAATHAGLLEALRLLRQHPTVCV